MNEIKKIFGRQILDSRGNPTVEVEIILNNGVKSRASVPSGASTGEHEAIEKRDNDNSKYLGKGVSKVINNINFEINNNLQGLLPFDQEKIDQKLEIESGANIALKLRKTKQLSDTPVENLDNNEEM